MLEAHAKAWPSVVRDGSRHPARRLPGSRLARSDLYKSPCGNETMTRRELNSPSSSLPFPVSTCAKTEQMPHSIGLAAHDISCQRGGRTIFHGLSFSLAPGEALLVSGPNGAGKTSLLRQIAGLLPLDAGRLSLEGAAPDAALPELCHYVGHANAIKTSLSVARESRLLGRFSRRRRHEPRPRACRVRAWRACRASRRPSLGGAEAEARAVAPLRRAAPDLAARRAAGLARRRLGQAARAAIEGSPRGAAASRSSRATRRSRRNSRASSSLAARSASREAALALLRRDVKLAWREGGAIGTALGFYLVVVAITPLGLGPDLNLLSRIAPGMLWVALLLAALLSADRIFHNDYEDGALDVLTTGPLPLPLVAAIKSLTHWLTTGVPLALLAPVLGLLLNLPLAGDPAARAVDARRHARGELRRRDRREPHAGLAAQRPAARAARAAALRAGPDLRRRDRVGRHHRPRLALAAVPHALRLEPRQHRARPARRRRRAPHRLR